MHRRAFLASAIAATAGQAHLQAASTGRLKLSVFAKHLQFVPLDRLPSVVAELGFDGADLPVRPRGVIEPDRVATDLKPLVQAFRKQNVEVPMITSHIVDTNTPHAEAVLDQLKNLGINHYRWDGFKYDYKRPLTQQLEELKRRVAALEKLNRKYGVKAIYHTHSGVGRIGASIWDLHLLLKDCDPRHIAINYDVGHATIEGGLGGWINSFGITGRHLGGIALKDFQWERNPKGGWRAEWTPLGEGMVKLPEFFKMLVARTDFNGPVQIHYEYDLGGADEGKTQITIPEKEVFAAMKRDLTKLRGWMKEAGL